MHIIEHRRPGLVILEPTERLTVETEADLKEAVWRLLAVGHTRLVLDLARVPYIDSCGLGAIAHAHLSASRRGGWLKLLNVNARNLQALLVTRLLSVLHLYELYEPEKEDDEEDQEEEADLPQRTAACG